MKHNKQHDNAKPAGPELVPVRFEFTHPTARTVCIAGTFNDWQPEAKPMHPLGNGRWLKESALPPGNYEYRLVVDGQWMPDPKARQTVANPFGGCNSVLTVAPAPGAAHPASAGLAQPTDKKASSEKDRMNQPSQASQASGHGLGALPAGLLTAGRPQRALPR